MRSQIFESAITSLTHVHVEIISLKLGIFLTYISTEVRKAIIVLICEAYIILVGISAPFCPGGLNYITDCTYVYL